MYIPELRKKLGVRIPDKGTENIKTRCPKCSGDRKSDFPLSVNPNKGIWNCHRCGYSGSVGYKRPEVEKTYAKPKQLHTLSDPVRKYLIEERHISGEALDYYKVGSAPRMVRGQKKMCIAFNYFKDGRHINVKYKSRDKEFQFVSGAELCLFGGDLIGEASDYIILTEGEEDALSYFSSGLRFAASVPNGANKGKNNLSYLDDYIENLEQVSRIYISTDHDEQGEKLAEDLANRLGKNKCFRVKLPEKDANSTLKKHGLEALRNAVKSAEPWPISGIVRASDVANSVMGVYENGLPEGYRIGSNLDRIKRFYEKEFVVVTGVPGHGKTTWVDFLMIELARLHGFRFGVWSHEKSVTMQIIHLCHIYLGKAPRRGFSTEEEVFDAMGFIYDHFFFIEDEMDELGKLLDTGSQLHHRYGIDALVVDNWSGIAPEYSGDRGDIALAKQHNKMVDFKKSVCSIIVVAHPSSKKGVNIKKKDNMPVGYDLSGGAMWYNKIDVGLTVHRDHNDDTTVRCWKERHDHLGGTGDAFFKFDPKSRRFADRARSGADETLEEKVRRINETDSPY